MKIMTEGNPWGTTVGIDLAKSVFAVHGVDVRGKVARLLSFHGLLLSEIEADCLASNIGNRTSVATSYA